MKGVMSAKFGMCADGNLIVNAISTPVHGHIKVKNCVQMVYSYFPDNN